MTRVVQEHPTLAARSLSRPILAALVAGALLLAVTAVQAVTPEQACKAGKNKTAGKYAACRENAEAKLAAGGDPSKYTDAIDKCESKFSDAWSKLETKALEASASCPADDTVIKGQTDGYTDRVAALVAGARFEDNLDGTVTDHETGLQWERKQNLDGIQNLADPHDADNGYTWTATTLGTPLNGTVSTDFLDKLNGGLGASTCFAGQCDWRLPTMEELQTILLDPYPSCSTSPCIDPIFGPTPPSRYWTASTLATNPVAVLRVDFFDGYLDSGFKYQPRAGRAVRAGS